jgi:hypothetical protein
VPFVPAGPVAPIQEIVVPAAIEAGVPVELQFPTEETKALVPPPEVIFAKTVFVPSFM